MKAIKLVMPIMAVVIIGIIVALNFIDSDPPPGSSLPVNQFTQRIEHEIDSLGRLPVNKFCGDFYREIGYHINTFYEEKRLSKVELENGQWKTRLTKNLYSRYANKFIEQAFFVFNGIEWHHENLKFIRKEYQLLRKSSLLESSSPVAKKFIEINIILAKHDEIAGFIASCYNFPIPESGLHNSFSILEVKEKISRAITYQSNQLENSFVNNCARLHTGLKNVPLSLFQRHVKYLDSKINQWSGLFSNYNSQLAYGDNLYRPLENEIKSLDNDIYKVAVFDQEFGRLTKKWGADAVSAYNYFNKR